VNTNLKLENLEKYSDLIKKLDSALDGEEIDDVVPALVSFLAMAGCIGGVNKRLLLAYFVDTLDKTYKERDRRATN